MNELIKDVNPNADEIANLEAQIASIDISALDPMDNGKVVGKQSPVVENKVQQPVKDTPVQTQATEVIQTEDPIKAELERVKGQTQGKTPAEKMAFKLKLEAQRAKEMGIDIQSVLGIKSTDTSDTETEDLEDKPLTRKDIQDIIKTVTKPETKSVHDFLSTIENDAERELTEYYLNNKIKSSGDPEADFNDAKMLVDAIKVKNNIQLQNIRPQAQSYSTGHSVQPNVTKNTSQKRLSPDEEYLIRDAKARGIDLTDLLK